jgi:hypothetical protein
LYENVDRNISPLHTLLIFDIYLSDEGNDVYYIAFYCDI